MQLGESVGVGERYQIKDHKFRYVNVAVIVVRRKLIRIFT